MSKIARMTMLIQFEDGTRQAVPWYGGGQAPKQEAVAAPTAFCDLRLQRGVFYVDDIQVAFTGAQADLLELLFLAQGGIVKKQKALQAIYGECGDAGVMKSALDGLILRTRAKLKDHNAKCEIRTIRGRGYQLVERVE